MPAPFSLGFGVPYSEAIAAAEARKAVLPDTFYDEIPAQLRQYAFTVGGLTALDQVTAVLDSLNTKLAAGGSFQEWKRDALEQDWGIPKSRLELISRVHSQTAYMAGHWERFNASASTRPFLMYSAINDNRTRPAHRAMNGQIAPVNDPLWLRWSPPCGYNCRCSLISLTEEQARARGLGQQTVPTNVQPDEGFGAPPAEAADRIGQLLENRAKQAGPAFVSAIDRIMQGGYTVPPLLPEQRMFAATKRDDLRAQFGDRYDDMTDAQIWAMRQYATDSFPINAFMRGLMDATDDTKRDIAEIQNALTAMSDGVERVTYRGAMADPKFDRVAREAFHVGNVIQNAAFLSTSSSDVAASEFADRYVFTIRGRSGVNVDGFYHEAEGEYLYPAGTRFRVTRVQRIAEVTFVDLVETDEPATFTFSA